jgi:hypothetical protein
LRDRALTVERARDARAFVSGLTRAATRHTLRPTSKPLRHHRSGERVALDTEIGTWDTAVVAHPHRGLPAVRDAISRRVREATRRAGLVALCLAGLASYAAAQSTAVDATVLLVRGERVYVALADSLALAPGDRLEFALRGRSIAAGEIVSVHQGVLAIARLTSGSLRSAKKRLDRVRMVATHPVERAAASLRVGYPSPLRNPFCFACDRMSLREAWPARAYRIDASTDHSYRLLREPGVAADAPWPDTLIVRLFDESADEEIALERGEVDAAMFWPGELSRHVRDQPRWQDPLYGTRARGWFAAMWVAGDSAEDSSGSRPFADDPRFASLNQELYRGDLAPFIPAQHRAASAPAPERGPSGPVRFEVDTACPGHSAMERLLNRGGSALAHSGRVTRVRVFGLDAPVDDPAPATPHAPDELRTGPFARDSIPPGERVHVAYLFALRCPLVCTQRIRVTLNALGADALVNLFDCEPAGLKP